MNQKDRQIVSNVIHDLISAFGAATPNHTELMVLRSVEQLIGLDEPLRRKFLDTFVWEKKCERIVELQTYVNKWAKEHNL